MAENRPKTGRGVKGRFQKGVSGNPGGRPKILTEVRDAAAALVDDPIYRDKLARDLRQRRVAPAIEQMLWYYAKGKPRETMDLHTGLTEMTPESVAQLTDEELAVMLQISRRLTGRG